DGELLRFRARQQHAVVERVQEPLLTDPALVVDERALHHGDLAGGAAEGLQRDAEPDRGRLAERYQVAHRDSMADAVASAVASGRHFTTQRDELGETDNGTRSGSAHWTPCGWSVSSRRSPSRCSAAA